MVPVLANLVAVGRMTEEEAATDSKRHALRSAVMGDEIHLVDVSSQPVAVRKSDRVLLASDGLMTLADEEIARILQEMSGRAPRRRRPARSSMPWRRSGRPHQDNTTVLLYAPEADCGVETLPDDTAQEKSEQGEETQRSRKETGLSGLWSALKKALTASTRSAIKDESRQAKSVGNR